MRRLPLLAALPVAVLCTFADDTTPRLSVEEATRMTRAIASDVEELRGLTFREPVGVEVVDRDGAAEHLLQRLEAFDLLDAIGSQQRLYAALGLIEPDVDLAELYAQTIREQAGGFYNPANRTLYLLDEAAGAMVSILAAHELTHALEDQHYDLDGRIAGALGDDDRSFAVGAVHEGSATLLMTIFTARMAFQGELDMEELQAQAAADAERTASMRATPPILTRALLGSYVLGANFVARGNVMGTAIAGLPTERLERLFADGPVSSEQILHPEKFWPAATRDDPLPVATCGAGRRLGRGHALEATGTFGELNLGSLIGLGLPDDTALQTFDPAAWTDPAVAGWGGDRWELWATRAGRAGRDVALVATRWDTEADAREFEEAIADRGWRVARRGDAVALIVGAVPEKRARRVLDALLACRPPADRIQ